MTIAVLGAAGHLGRRIVAALLDRGIAPEDLCACVRTPDKAVGLWQANVVIRAADYDDPKSLVAAFADSEIVVLVPTFAPVEHRVGQYGNAVAAAVAAGVRRLVFVGFAAAQPNSRFLIAPFMLYAEARTRLCGLDWTIVRNGMYLDPVADWMPDLWSSGRLPYPVRHGRVAYVCRDDLARGIAAAAADSGHGQRMYDLTGPEALSMPDLAAAIGAAGNRPVEFQRVCEDAFADLCRDAGEPEAIIPLLISLYRAVDNGEFEAVTDHIERLTGTPPLSPAEYLRRRAAE